MTTPATGPLKFSDINIELGLGSTTQISMSAALTRTLAGVASGAISFSNLRGKSNRQVVTYVISADTANGVITLGTTTPTSGTYVAGKSDCTITIGSGIYVYGTVAAGAGLTVSGGAVGDTLAIVNNGVIMGLGGNGSGYALASTVGNTALNITTTVSGTVAITNNSYIVGGGGGGAGYQDLSAGTWGGGGGGGAGGGQGGSSPVWPGWAPTPAAGASGGTIRNAGGAGGWRYNTASTYQHLFGGGGGGRLPTNATGGSTGVSASASSGSGGGGGGAGGGGAGGYAGAKTTFYASGGGGGFGATGGSAGTTGALVTSSGANGGANFANGGSAGTSSGTGKAGGAAVKHAGVTVSVSGGNTWGATT